VGELLTFSLPLFFTGMLALFQQWTDTFMLSYFRTITEVGLYNVAFLLASLVSLIPNLILPVAFPHVINYYGRGERDDARALAHQVSRWILLAMLPATLWLVLLRSQLLSLLFGSSYMVGGWVVAVLAIGYLALSLSLPCRRILSMLKRTDLIFKSTALSVAVNVVGNLLLIPRYGIVGAAVATAGAMVVHYLLVQWWAWRSFSFTFFDQRTPLLLGALLLAGVALVGVKAALGYNLIALLVGTLAFGSIYLAALSLLGALDASDWDVVRGVGERVKQRGWRGWTERPWSPSLAENPEEE
jgi:O-antigen/teichoic acid export membrane protein